MRDLHNKVAVRQTLAPAVATSDRTSAAADRRGFESVEHIVALGASGDALTSSRRIDLRLEHSHDDTAWEPVSDADVLGVVVDANGVFATIDDATLDESVYSAGYVGGRRYSRVVADFAGSHANGTPVAALALMSHAHVKPV